MMHNELYLMIIVAAIAGLWYVWDQGFKKLFLDYFRDHVFQLRFELFKLAASGRLPFDSEAYRALETLQCGLLRFAHRITFLGFILSAWQQGKSRKANEYIDYHAQIELKISRAPADVRDELRSILSRTSQMVSVFMAVCSLLFLLIAVGYSILRALNLVRDERRKASSVIETEAYRDETRRPLPGTPVVA